MLSEFECDTAAFILSKFGLILIHVKENKFGLSVIGQFRTKTDKEAWARYHKIVADTRIRLPGALIGAEIVKASEGFLMLVEIY